jgi:hypothetical protein
MANELDDLMLQYGVSAPPEEPEQIANLGANATQDQTDQYNKNLAAYNTNQQAYQKYADEYSARTANPQQYMEAQYQTGLEPESAGKQALGAPGVSSAITDWAQTNPNATTADVNAMAANYGVNAQDIYDATSNRWANVLNKPEYLTYGAMPASPKPVVAPVVSGGGGASNIPAQLPTILNPTVNEQTTNAAPTAASIKEFVAANINNPKTIVDAAKANNISNEQIADATGYTLSNINDFLNYSGSSNYSDSLDSSGTSGHHLDLSAAGSTYGTDTGSTTGTSTNPSQDSLTNVLSDPRAIQLIRDFSKGGLSVEEIAKGANISEIAVNEILNPSVDNYAGFYDQTFGKTSSDTPVPTQALIDAFNYKMDPSAYPNYMPNSTENSQLMNSLYALGTGYSSMFPNVQAAISALAGSPTYAQALAKAQNEAANFGAENTYAPWLTLAGNIAGVSQGGPLGASSVYDASKTLYNMLEAPTPSSLASDKALGNEIKSSGFLQMDPKTKASIDAVGRMADPTTGESYANYSPTIWDNVTNTAGTIWDNIVDAFTPTPVAPVRTLAPVDGERDAEGNVWDQSYNNGQGAWWAPNSIGGGFGVDQGWLDTFNSDWNDTGDWYTNYGANQQNTGYYWDSFGWWGQ